MRDWAAAGETPRGRGRIAGGDWGRFRTGTSARNASDFDGGTAAGAGRCSRVSRSRQNSPVSMILETAVASQRARQLPDLSRLPTASHFPQRV